VGIVHPQCYVRSWWAVPTLLVLCAGPLLAQEPKQDATKKLVIPFDFESKFDGGEYGRIIGDQLWKKLQRQGGFILPESMQDVRDWCERSKFLPGPETPLAKMKDVVVKEQAGDIGIWGKVERVPGHEEDVYDLSIRVVDFSVDPARVIYDRKARTRTVSEIPHVYVKEALDSLYDRPPQSAGAPATPWSTTTSPST